MNKIQKCAVTALLVGATQNAASAEWSTTQVDFQYGSLDTPTFGIPGVVGGSFDTTVITLQHASGWKYGDNFFFIDHLNSDDPTGFNNTDWYGEWYSHFSYSKISGNEFRVCPIKDIGLMIGINAAADANVLKYTPGFRLSWDVPGFAFLNTEFYYAIDDSEGIAGGGLSAPAEDDRFFVDVNWLAFFMDGKISFAGHIEYFESTTNEFGGDVSDWILAQPQIRYHFNDHLSAGIEYQYWQNKLGDESTDESAVQMLVTWTF